jgi:hypothetical protein
LVQNFYYSNWFQYLKPFLNIFSLTNKYIAFLKIFNNLQSNNINFDTHGREAGGKNAHPQPKKLGPRHFPTQICQAHHCPRFISPNPNPLSLPLLLQPQPRSGAAIPYPLPAFSVTG